MIIHRIRRNWKLRIPCDADRIVKAMLGDRDISNKYNAECQCFMLGHDDTDISSCELTVEFEKDGVKTKETHCVEVI